MAFKAIKMPVSVDPPPNEWKLEGIDGGIVYTDLPQKILNSQSPKMLNMWYKERALTKRYGQEYVFDSLGAFPILSNYEKLYKGKVIFAASTKLYSLDLTTDTATEIHSGLTAAKGSFFVMSDKLYYKNGHEYVVYDGTTVSDVVGYIPLVITGRAPTGGGTVYEQYNRIQPGFKTSFSAAGAATVYQLPLTNLDATAVTATVNGAAKAEGTDFTVNRTLGQVTFSAAPTDGTDNVVITAYKTDSASKAVIDACKYCTTFGGDNDTRVFIAGDSTTYYYSGLLDPTYWPENQYNNAGVDSSYIYGFGKQYNVLVVFKERSMYAVTYSFDGTTVRFPMALLNDSVGCDMPYTIQLINDRLTWCNTYSGPQILASTNIKDEKNVRPIGENIRGTLLNPGLLNETKTNLQAATSIDFFGHYWLCVGSKVWAWNYEISPFVDTGNIYEDQRRLAWFPFTNVNANCFIGVNQDLYYGDRTVGRYIHFVNNYKDFDNSITASWKSKTFDFDRFDWTKAVLELRAGTKSDTYTTITTKYYYDDNEREDPTKDTVSKLSWANFHWGLFSWRVVNFARTITKRPKIKSTVYFAVEFSNDIAGHNLSILDLVILWLLYRRVK